MRKIKRFGVGGSTDEEGKKDIFKNYEAKEYEAPRAYSESSDAPAKRIITKEQVEAKGFTNLQDFLNDERKLKRKDGKPAERVTNSSVSGDDLSKYYANQKKPAEAAAKPAAAAPKKESAADVTAEIDKNVKSKGFEDALSYALPVGAAAAAGTAAYKLGAKGLMKKVADKFAPKTYEVVRRKGPSLAPKAEVKAAEKYAADTARSKASKEPAERAIEAQRAAARDNAKRSGEGRDYSEYKKGGKVKVKSASSRADGCAIRGKTRA